MAQSTKGKLNYRCPVCFSRDIDIDMFYDEDKQEYYCLRCCFHGDENKVRRLNEQCKAKYGHLKDRVVDFGEDNQPVKFVPYHKVMRKDRPTRLGVDTSTYFEEDEAKATYLDENGKQMQPLDVFKSNGVDIMRIRLWVDPYDENGNSYLGGGCDLNNFIKLATLAKSKGYSIMLDIHYSDFWADPGKQTIPKGWEQENVDVLATQVYRYTLKVLKRIKKYNIPLEYIQVGNEITNGFLWPVGKLIENEDGSRSNYENFIKLLKSGIKACREINPKSSIILHLEKSYDQNIYDEFFIQMEENEVDYDVIGFSYYPYWHGTFDMFFANVDFCKKFNKREMVVEVGYAFTMEDYIKHDHGGAHLVVCEENIDTFQFVKEYPISKEGQKEFIKKFLQLSLKHGLEAVIWWEPLWIPGNGICWTSKEAQKYIKNNNESIRNEWANQCLFDYDGNKNPAFDEFVIHQKS